MTATALALTPAATEAQTLRVIAASIAPDPELTPAEWAARYYHLPARGSAKPGPWRHPNAPFAIGILDALAPAAPWERVVFMAPAQLVKTEILLILAGYTIHQAPASMMVVQPTGKQVKRFSQQRLQGALDATPALRGLVAPAGRRDSGNTLDLKVFPNGQIAIVSAQSPTDLSGTPVKILGLDEVDRYPQTLGEEGDPIQLAIYRTEQYPGGKIYECSTPLVAGTSRIAADLAACDVEMHYHVPCPHCGHAQVLTFDRLVWPDGCPEDAAYRCAGCEALIPHRAKPAMVRAGQWRPIRDSGRTASIGFHLNRLYALMGKTTWGTLARKLAAAREDPRLLRTVTNLDMALPFAEAHDKPDWRRLYERRECYEQGVVPHGVVELFLAVDVQGGQTPRIEAQLVGFGRGMEAWSIGYYVFGGDVAAGGVLEQLEPLLARDWPCEGGGTLPIRLCVVDQGYKSTHVQAWVRTHEQPVTGPTGTAVPKPRMVAAIVGRDFWGEWFRTPRTLEGARKRRGVKLFQVGASELKAAIYAALKLDPPTDPEWAAGKGFPRRYLHLPEYDPPFFEGLVAEECRTRVTKRGEQKLEWFCAPGLRNEPLDTLVYAYAAAAMAGLPRWSEAKWTARERARYGDQPVPRVRPRLTPPVSTSPGVVGPRVALAEVPTPPAEGPRPAPPRPHRRRVRMSSYVQRMMRR